MFKTSLGLFIMFASVNAFAQDSASPEQLIATDPPANPPAVEASGEWSYEAQDATISIADKGVAPSEFLGSIDQLAPYGRVNGAWFAADFDPAKFATVTVAAPANALGRSHVPGSRVLQGALVKKLAGLKMWKKKVTAGSDGALVIYSSFRARYVDLYALREVVDFVLVDRAAGTVVGKFQVKTGYDGRVANAIALGAGDFGAAKIDEGDQAVTYAFVQMDLMAKVMSVFTNLGKDLAAKKAPASGASELPALPVAQLAGDGVERMGPGVAGQIDSLAARVSGAAKDKERYAPIIDLANVGSRLAVAPLLSIATDKKAYSRGVRDTAVWALGELGVEESAAAIEGIKGGGIKGSRKKAELAKITEL